MNWLQELAIIPRWKEYSQANEECYLEHILKNLPIINRTIVEFGAGDGQYLSNSKYFIDQKGYTGILFDGDNRGNEAVKQVFLTKENVIQTMQENNVPNAFDLLCIDLDGNDLYILEEVLKNYKPMVIVAEFNPIWQRHESKVITYNPNHVWNNDDYYGFSFAAGVNMAAKYGYVCVFQNDNLNMYFVEYTELVRNLPMYYIPPVNYNVVQYHPKAKNTNWINY